MHTQACTIIAHGCPDGVISAALVVIAATDGPEVARFLWTQPSELPDIEISAGDEPVYLLDVAPDYRRPDESYATIQALLNQGHPVTVIDHHARGWSAETLQEMGAEALIDPAARACAQLVPRPANHDEGQWDLLVGDALALDSRDPDCPLSPRGALIEKAIKARPRDDHMRSLAACYAAGDESLAVLLSIESARYEPVLAATDELATEYHLVGGVALVDCRQSNVRYDVARLSAAGKQLAPVQVILQSHGDREKLVVTARQPVDLVETLGLSAGRPGRVSLPVSELSRVVSTFGAVAA